MLPHLSAPSGYIDDLKFYHLNPDCKDFTGVLWSPHTLLLGQITEDPYPCAVCAKELVETVTLYVPLQLGLEARQKTAQDIIHKKDIQDVYGDLVRNMQGTARMRAALQKLNITTLPDGWEVPLYRALFIQWQTTWPLLGVEPTASSEAWIRLRVRESAVRAKARIMLREKGFYVHGDAETFLVKGPVEQFEVPRFVRVHGLLPGNLQSEVVETTYALMADGVEQRTALDTAHALTK